MLRDMDALINVTLAYAPAATVLVATIIARGEAEWVQNVTLFNAALPGVVSKWAAAGHNVSLVDMHARSGLCTQATPPGGAPNGTECCADRVHPTQGGYAIMAGVWWEYLRGLFPPEPVAAGAEAGSL